MTAAPSQGRSEGGFTLPELLIAITLLGLIVGAITASLILGIKTTDGTAFRLSASHDAQLLSLYFPSDAQNATTTTVPAAADTTCSGAPGGLLRLQWVGVSGAQYTSVYRLEGTTVRRYFCDSTVNSGLPLALDVTHDVITVTPAASPPALAVSVCAASPAQCTSLANQLTFTSTANTRGTTNTPCTLVSASLSPTSTSHTGGGALGSDIGVTVVTSGLCFSMTISYTPGGAGSTSPQTSTLIGGPTTWTGTIGKSIYSWTAGPKPIDVIFGGAVLLANATTLTVT